MLIRKAQPNEANEIAPLILQAMGDIAYHLIGENSPENAIKFLESLVSESGNQYSFENCWVAEVENAIVAVALVYNGGKLQELRQPVIHSIKSRFNRRIYLEDETQDGEYYIDCIAVDPALQGKGIGTKMFEFLIDEYVYKARETLGLLVDKENPPAKKLYLKLGFTIVSDKTFAGKQLEHLQFLNNTHL